MKTYECAGGGDKKSFQISCNIFANLSICDIQIMILANKVQATQIHFYFCIILRSRLILQNE